MAVTPGQDVPFAPRGAALVVAGIQGDTAWHDPEESLRRVTPMAREAREAGARMIVLPEMFATGFSMDVATVAAMAPAIRGAVAQLARDLGATIVAGVAEAEEGGAGEAGDRANGAPRGRNMALIYAPDGGLVAEYQKIHPFSFGSEEKHYAGGASLARFACGPADVTPLVCYDLRFPEVFRAAAERTHLFVVIANWPAARRAHWRTLLVARAIENQAYLLGVNRVGSGGGLDYVGDSLLVDPWGAIVADGGGAAGIIRGEVDTALVADARAKFSPLRDRRPDVYARLS